MPTKSPPKSPQLRMPESYFQKNFNTGLSQVETPQYQKWVSDLSAKQNRNVANDTIEYDLQGFWKSGLGVAGNGHMTDTYKKPNHPSFSDQSQYHGTVNPTGGRWIGGQWKENSYLPSPEMLQATHYPDDMERYFKQNEPGITLNFPQDAASVKEIITSFPAKNDYPMLNFYR